MLTNQLSLALQQERYAVIEQQERDNEMKG